MASGKASTIRKSSSSGSRSARRRAREFALQGLYQWQLAGTCASVIEEQFAEAAGFDKIDADYFHTLLAGTIAAQAELEPTIARYLDRPIHELSPIERGILFLASFELKQQIDVPYRVVINEAVELAKTFGGTDGHKYVNGVLDKMATELRGVEVDATHSTQP